MGEEKTGQNDLFKNTFYDSLNAANDIISALTMIDIIKKRLESIDRTNEESRKKENIIYKSKEIDIFDIFFVTVHQKMNVFETEIGDPHNKNYIR